MTQLAPAPEQTVQPRKERDPFFDNAKYLAILLVAIGHAIVGLRHQVVVADALYFYVYLFHMPLFIVITGYFSRNFTFSGRKAQKLITNLGVPYVLFEIAYSVVEWRLTGNDFRISLLDPVYLTWFMLALFLWRLSTPVWQQIRWSLPISVVIALISYTGPLSGQLDMHRVFGLAPFYVLGLCLRKEHFEYLRRPWMRVAGGVTLAVAFAGMFYVKDHMNYLWLYWRDSNEALGVNQLTGSVMRLAMMVAGTVLVAAFLSVVPRRRMWFSTLGTTTIYAYLLHGFFVKYFQYMKWDRLSWLQNPAGLLLVIACSAVLATVLCTPPVVRVMHWAVEPRAGWAFTRLRQPAKPAREIQK
ncbi:MAG: acyltransferase family protein [Streptosporangiaceae bacterium]